LELVSPEWLGLLAVIALAAGFIDAIAGGGGLLTIPALMMAGLNPLQALATNKAQACFGSFSATWYFVRRGLVKLSEVWEMIALVLIGSALGTWSVQLIDTSILEDVMPLLLIGIAVYTLLSKKLGEDTRQRRISDRLFAVTAAFAVGFYDGFFGPGTGTFFALAFVSLLGMHLVKATAHAKVMNFTSNIISFAVFAVGGHVVWVVAAAMAVGQLVGARLGAKMVMAKGTALIKPVTIIVCLVMSVSLLLKP
jgi:uncharacterized protein